jgi:hypothetical protein
MAQSKSKHKKGQLQRLRPQRSPKKLLLHLHCHQDLEEPWQTCSRNLPHNSSLQKGSAGVNSQRRNLLQQLLRKLLLYQRLLKNKLAIIKPQQKPKLSKLQPVLGESQWQVGNKELSQHLDNLLLRKQD